MAIEHRSEGQFKKMSRHTLITVFLAAIIAWGLTGCHIFPGWSHDYDDFFTVVLLPDTQNYTDSSFGGLPQYFYDQTQWIKKQRQSLNIVMVAHAGDIVQNPDNRSEWEIADQAFNSIDSDVPYILCLGNHDITNDQSTDAEGRATLLNTYFPPRRFTDNPIYSRSFGPDPQRHFMEPGKSDNYYLYFEGGDTQFLIMALEFKPRDATLHWANRVIGAHPDHRCIVLIHAYLNSSESLCMGNYKLPGNQPLDMWKKFVILHPNIFLVLCGHALGEAVLTSKGQAGNQVHQVLADYQNDYIGKGGAGYLRIMTFYPAKKEIKTQTYSPTLGTYLARPESQFTLRYE